jgi:uncharacterized protein
MLFKSYRCRNCKRRFHKLTNAPALATITGLSVFTVFAFGIAAGRLIGGAYEDVGTTTAGVASQGGSAALAVDGSAPPPRGDYELVAAAEQGDGKAQYELGMAYLRGEGTVIDLGLAYKWIEKSATQGYADAQFALGHMHQGGRGALQSLPLAFKWYELAAQQEHAEAQYRLGLMYRIGQGVQMDKPKAYIWFTIAAAQGHVRAREARDNLLPALTPQQAEEAQRAAQEWRPALAKG